MWRLVAVALLALPLGSSVALAEDMKLPPLKKQPTPQAVIRRAHGRAEQVRLEPAHGAVSSRLST